MLPSPCTLPYGSFLAFSSLLLVGRSPRPSEQVLHLSASPKFRHHLSTLKTKIQGSLGCLLHVSLHRSPTPNKVMCCTLQPLVQARIVIEPVASATEVDQ